MNILGYIQVLCGCYVNADRLFAPTIPNEIETLSVSRSLFNLTPDTDVCRRMYPMSYVWKFQQDLQVYVSVVTDTAGFKSDLSKIGEKPANQLYCDFSG
jgi:hypothetical protein